jgi:excisionase family DNA binding protein
MRVTTVTDNRGAPAAYSRAECAVLLACSEQFVDRLIRDHQLRAVHWGRRIFIPERSVAEFLDGAK